MIHRHPLLSFFFLLCLVLTLTVPASAAGRESGRTLETAVNGETLPDADRAVLLQNVILVPLYVLSERMGFRTGWLAETRTVRLEAFGQVIYLPLDQKVGLVDGRSFKLVEPAQSLGGRTFVPLRFIAEILGLEVHYSEAARRVEIKGPQCTLTGVRYALSGGRPRIVLTAGPHPPAAKTSLKRNPLRLVLDLPSTRLGMPAGTLPTGDPLVKEVAWSQGRHDTVHLTLTLAREMPYAVETADGSLSVVFPPQVREAGLVVDGGRRLLTIQSTAPLRPKVTRLSEPDRLVIDLPGAALAGPPRIPVDDPWVKDLRLSQWDSRTVRVVADLEGPLGWEAVPPAGETQDGAALAFHLLNRVLAVDHLAFPDHTELRLQLAVPALPTVVVDRQAGRLQLDLPEAVGEDLAAEIPINDGTVSRLRLLSPGPGTVQWVVDLPYYLGHETRTGKDGSAVISLAHSAVFRRRIFLDPGHGGADPGAIGPNGAMEKEVNLDIALRLRQVLQEAGAEVVMSREDDRFVPLHDRPAQANGQQAAVFVSLHSNANLRPDEGGTETYFHPDRPESRALAAEIQAKLVEALGLMNRGIRPTRDFVVVREAAMPSVLIEVAFLSNPAEEKLLADPAFRQRVAEAAARGIAAYFQKAAAQQAPPGPIPPGA
ncbi:MAG TPA: AMIN domain-containing protein [Firmicutes bacterium]|nr:AMIN domain-containing protein [Bacillota bacterium]